MMMILHSNRMFENAKINFAEPDTEHVRVSQSYFFSVFVFLAVFSVTYGGSSSSARTHGLSFHNDLSQIHQQMAAWISDTAFVFNAVSFSPLVMHGY